MPQRTQAKELLHELSAAYPSYNLDSGQAQPPERVAQRLRACWDQLTQLADAADLPERCRQQLRKAQRVSHSLLEALRQDSGAGAAARATGTKTTPPTKTALSPAASCMSGSGRNDDHGH